MSEHNPPVDVVPADFQLGNRKAFYVKMRDSACCDVHKAQYALMADIIDAWDTWILQSLPTIPADAAASVVMRVCTMLIYELYSGIFQNPDPPRDVIIEHFAIMLRDTAQNAKRGAPIEIKRPKGERLDS